MFPITEATSDDDGSQFFAELEAALFDDDGLAAKQHLAAGLAIYYGDEKYPGAIVKQYPNGRKQLVSVGKDGQISVIRDI